MIKNILFILALLFCTEASASQYVAGMSAITIGTSANVINIGTTGNVGIGTAAPSSYLLQVNGAVQFCCSGVTTIGFTSMGIGIGTSAPLNYLDVGGPVVIGTSYQGVKAGPTNGLAVQGNVGVGTNSPTTALQVAGQISVTSGNIGIFEAPAYVSGTYYLATYPGGAFTSTNTSTESSNTTYCTLAFAYAPFGIDTVSVRTSSSNASSGASIKACVYAADGTGGVPGTLLGKTTTGTSIGDSAVSTNYELTLDATANVSQGPYYVCTLHTFSTTAARFAITSAIGGYLQISGASSVSNGFSTAPILGYSNTQTYSNGCASPFGSATAITTPGTTPIALVKAH